jgi:serine protease Do
MKQYVLRISGLGVIILLMQMAAFSQDRADSSTSKSWKLKDKEEIIVRPKGGKDSKIVIEIKDGMVTVNGKPIEDFDDEDVIVRKKRNDFGDLDELRMIAPEIAQSPFRSGQWNYNNNEAMGKYNELNDSKTAFLGVTTESADNGGTEITEVTRGSAAEKIGLKKGDIITKFGDTKVDSHEDLVEAIHQHKPLDKVPVTFKRDGKEQKLTATLGKTNGFAFRSFNYSMPKIKEFSQDMPYAFSYSNEVNRPRLGIKAQDTEDGKGVKVLDVDEDSPADKAGVKEGDIITQFEGKEVNSAEALSTLARENRAKYELKLKLLRDGKSEDVDIKMPRKLKTTDL